MKLLFIRNKWQHFIPPQHKAPKNRTVLHHQPETAAPSEYHRLLIQLRIPSEDLKKKKKKEKKQQRWLHKIIKMLSLLHQIKLEPTTLFKKFSFPRTSHPIQKLVQVFHILCQTGSFVICEEMQSMS